MHYTDKVFKYFIMKAIGNQMYRERAEDLTDRDEDIILTIVNDENISFTPSISDLNTIWERFIVEHDDRTLYLWGKGDSEWKIEQGSALYKFLEDNYEIIDILTDEEEAQLTESTFGCYYNADTGVASDKYDFTEEEKRLMNHLWYHFEYNGGYWFRLKQF